MSAYPISVSGPVGPSNSGGVAYLGFSVAETSGTTSARVVMMAGNDPVDYVNLSPGESAREWYPPPSKSAGTQLSVTVTGAIEGVVYLDG